MAQGQNPFAPIVPCHRVLGADGALTGFSAPGGLETKQRLLLIEARACGQLAGEQGALF
jgi:methylated-DNA-[protein]-cysteine S-methyltransferase